MRRTRFWVIAAVLALAPARADAQGWWDFVESLSGPGPFEGGGGYWRLACATSDTWRGRTAWSVDWTCFNDANPDIKQIVEIRGLVAWAPEGERPVLIVDPADRRGVRLQKVDLISSLRVASFLDVGAGGGFVRFTAPGMEPVFRGTIIPFSATYTPLAAHRSDNPWRRLVRIRMEVTYIPFGFTGADWGKPTISPTAYATDGNWVMGGGVLFDIGSFF